MKFEDADDSFNLTVDASVTCTEDLENDAENNCTGITQGSLKEFFTMCEYVCDAS